MAFPTVQATATTNGTTAATNKVCNLPASIAANDLLILILRSAGADIHALPADWSWLVQNHADDASDDVTSIIYKKADGGEGTTVTVNGSASLKFASLAYRISGGADPSIQTPEISTAATGTSTTPDPNGLTPTGGAKDYLWLWIGGWEGEQTSPPAGNPTNYSNPIGANSGTAGAITTNCRVASARRTLNASTENPGSWTISVSDDWTAWTIAVHPFSGNLYSETGRQGGPIVLLPILRDIAALKDVAGRQFSDDDFKRPNSDDLGPAWTESENNSGTLRIIDSLLHTAGFESGNQRAGLGLFGAPQDWGNDQSVEMTFQSTAGDTKYFGPVVRGSGTYDKFTGYVLFYLADLPTPLFRLIIEKYQGTSLAFAGTVLSNDGITALVNGDRIKITVSGNTLTSYKNDIEVATVIDSAISSGQPGVAGSSGQTEGADAYIRWSRWRTDPIIALTPRMVRIVPSVVDLRPPVSETVAVLISLLASERDLAVFRDFSQIAQKADNFNRANSNALGGKWVETEEPSGVAIVIRNQKLALADRSAFDDNPDGFAYWDETFSNDQRSGIAITSEWTVSYTDPAGTAVRIQPGSTVTSFSGYAWGFRTGPNRIVLLRYDNSNLHSGTPTELGSFAATPTAGDFIETQAIGTTIRVLRNGVEIISVTDSTYSSGRLGIVGGGGNSAEFVTVFGNWQGGDTYKTVIILPTATDAFTGAQIYNETGRQGGPIVITATALSQLIGVDKPSATIVISPAVLAKLVAFERVGATLTIVVSEADGRLFTEAISQAITILTASSSQLVGMEKQSITLVVLPAAQSYAILPEIRSATITIATQVVSTAAFRDLPLVTAQIVVAEKDRAVLTDKDSLTIIISPTVSDFITGFGQTFNENVSVTAQIITEAFNQLIAKDRPGITVPFIVGETDAKVYSDLSAAAIQIFSQVRDRVILQDAPSQTIIIVPSLTELFTSPSGTEIVGIAFKIVAGVVDEFWPVRFRAFGQKSKAEHDIRDEVAARLRSHLASRITRSQRQ